LLTSTGGEDAHGPAETEGDLTMPAGHASQGQGQSQTLAKVTAFLCCVVAVGLLIASVFYPSAARAGQKAATPTPPITLTAIFTRP
jgi:hypothetical protein